MKPSTSNVPSQPNHAGVCPSCGYCPTCGRKNAAPVYPWYPYQPIWVSPYWYTGGTYTNPQPYTVTYQTTGAANPPNFAGGSGSLTFTA